VVERTIQDFILYLKQSRMQGHKTPVLLIGAGASLEAGIGTMHQLFQYANVNDFGSFSKMIQSRTPDERFIFLSDFLQTQEPAEVTPGYRALASLIADRYFDIILSTNFDPLLERCLS
jgi:NAD-dependent SIR2 family protein deacetylase